MSNQVRFRFDVPGDVHWMKQSKLNLPNALPKLGKPFFVFVHPTPELVFFSGYSRHLFPLRETDPHNRCQPLRLTSTQSQMLLPQPCWIMPALSGKAHGLDMVLDTPWWAQQSSILNIKSRCVTYVSAVTFNWLSKWSNCCHVSFNMTNRSVRDGSEDLRAILKTFPQLFSKRQETGKDPRGSKITRR